MHLWPPYPATGLSIIRMPIRHHFVDALDSSSLVVSSLQWKDFPIRKMSLQTVGAVLTEGNVLGCLTTHSVHKERLPLNINGASF